MFRQVGKFSPFLIRRGLRGGVLSCSFSFLLSTLAWAGTSPAPVIDYGASAGYGSSGVHIVAPGDTIYRISSQYGLDQNEILRLNQLAGPQDLRAGMRLKLPAPSTYRVRRGDDVTLVARTFSVSLDDLIRVNKLVKPYNLTLGQNLTLPRGKMVESVARQIMASRASEPIHTLQPMTLGQIKIKAPRKNPIMILASARSVMPSSVLGSLSYPSTHDTDVTREMLPTGPDQVVSSGGGMMTPPSAPRAMVAPAVSRPTIDPAPQTERVSLPPRASGGRFLKPVDGAVLSRFGPKSGGLYNEGINIAAARGTAVRAAEAGQVIYVGDAVDGYGNLILVKHADGYITTYAHLGKTLVKQGQVVKRGHTIGTVGSTGNTGGRAQLHFEIRKGRQSVDPTTLI